MTRTKKTRTSAPVAAVTQQLATYEPPTYHPDAGKKALQALTPQLDAIAESDFVTLRIDVEAATYAALGVAGFIAAPHIHARFARLPAEEIDPAHVDGLGSACFAMLYALGEARAAGALATDVKVAPEIQSEATDVEKRMQTVCEYQLSDDPDILPELDRLRPGSGPRDTANDLLGYARIYDLRPSEVKSDAKNFRPGDAAKARELAGKIIQALSMAMTPKARVAFDRYARMWTWLSRTYDEVRFAGIWLLRNDPQRDQRFPSLFAAGRPGAARSKKATDPAEPTPPVDDGNPVMSPTAKK
jgi:hypothetical protein